MERRDDMPELVYLGLWGIETRRAALAFMWGCIAVGVGSAIVMLRLPQAHVGVFLLLAAPWYWYAIRWVDKNSTWSQQG